MFKKVLFLLLIVFSTYAEEVKEIPEKIQTTTHSITIDGKNIPYKASAGTLTLKDDQDKPKASIFYIAYEKEGEESTRPITFCFNGGPGSSSVWLHLGVFGPRRIEPNGQLKDNPQSLLDLTDLVFIDPVSTGYSTAAQGVDAKEFHSVEEDVQSIAKFIRLYITRTGRWNSPKYLAGESYGTTRAAHLAGTLHDQYHLNLSGLILISSILNFQTLYDATNGNDLPYIVFLPSYTATAHYHQKLSPELQKDLKKTLADAQHFALNDYTLALMQGNALDPTKRRTIVQKMALYTGLSPDFIERSNLRIDSCQYAKELLRKENKTVGRFDSCITGLDCDGNGSYCEHDPSYEALHGTFANAINHYLHHELKFTDDKEYRMLTSIPTWDFGKSNQYLNVGQILATTLNKNPNLHVFVASGYYDLATPYFGTHYTFNHLHPQSTNITLKDYPGGHMLYLNPPNLIQLKKDLTSFYKN